MIQNQWYAILPSKKVKPGSLTAVKRLNLDLVLFRSAAGELGCVVDQCTHRGAALSAGKMSGDCVRCPFHGLEFDKGGKCTFIPANGKADTQDKSRYNVRAYPVKEVDDIIFLWYGDADKQTEKPPFFYGELDDMVYHEVKDRWNAHYSRAIENQLDVVHVPIVHYNTIGRGNKTLINGPKVLFEDEAIITSANNEMDMGQTPKSPQDSVIKSTYLKFRYPNIWMNHIADKIRVVIYFAPVDEENTILYLRFYNRITGFKPLNRFIAAVGSLANLLVERQDKRVVITQKPKPSALKSGEKLLMGDGPIIEYRKRREQLKTRATPEQNA